ncbi:MAG: class I SAM-dependent rRNA methyltransferase [Planctomycetota bacterium]|nr:class I SAM-dependent rRNA methyltransferase [Planctomycetota bacterium]MDW8373635.1 class I SAM-dependent rRNA methyltransferase [Planctomycetota bacterium]
MLRLRLAPRQTHRCLAGHPWVFRSELAPEDLAALPDGEAVAVHDRGGRLVGCGFASARSQIAVRLCRRDEGPLDEQFLAARLASALARRQALWPERAALRLVNSEGDLLPGLIVDRYGPCLVVQALTSAMERRLPALVDWLRRALEPAQILERSDGHGRQAEGLEPRQRLWHGPQETRWRVRLGLVELDLDLADAHKTGAYLDQIPAQLALMAWAPRGGRVADLFAHRGGFALHQLLAGAASAVAVDSSAAGLADARAAAVRLGLDLATERADVFAWLRAEHARGARYDLIILDPPSFARSRAQRAGALRGYRDLHLQALRLLPVGGRLASWSCSSHIALEELLASAVSAAAELGRWLRCEALFDQPPDHPWLAAAPETRYLKGFLASVADG